MYLSTKDHYSFVLHNFYITVGTVLRKLDCVRCSVSCLRDYSCDHLKALIHLFFFYREFCFLNPHKCHYYNAYEAWDSFLRSRWHSYKLYSLFCEEYAAAEQSTRIKPPPALKHLFISSIQFTSIWLSVLMEKEN